MPSSHRHIKESKKTSFSFSPSLSPPRPTAHPRVKNTSHSLALSSGTVSDSNEPPKPISQQLHILLDDGQSSPDKQTASTTTTTTEVTVVTTIVDNDNDTIMPPQQQSTPPPLPPLPPSLLGIQLKKLTTNAQSLLPTLGGLQTRISSSSINSQAGQHNKLGSLVNSSNISSIYENEPLTTAGTNGLIFDSSLSYKSPLNNVRFTHFTSLDSSQDQLTPPLYNLTNNSSSMTAESSAVCNLSSIFTALLPQAVGGEQQQQQFGASSTYKSIVDLAHDAELLETCTKRNDKYTVRRILDVHSSYFRINPVSSTATANNEIDRRGSSACYLTPAPPVASHLICGSIAQPTTQPANSKRCVPSIFFNILHLAIENNSLDVLRICLKHGLNPNEPGTTLRKHYLEPCGLGAASADVIGRVARKSVRFPLRCCYCKRRADKEKDSNAAVNIAYSNLKQTQVLIVDNETKINNNNNKINDETISNRNSNNQKLQSFELAPELTPFDQINYASFLYLVRLSPLFLSVSKCNHAATELLLTYGACPNVQDDLGIIFFFFHFFIINIFIYKQLNI